jgi:hypothetical protein
MSAQTKTRAGAATPNAGNFQLSQNNCAASRADIEAEQRDIIETPVAAQFEYRMALAGDALGDAARIIAVYGLLAEGAARRGDEIVTIERFQAIAAALNEASGVYRIAARANT